jgi:manganese/iron transport system permease protein
VLFTRHGRLLAVGFDRGSARALGIAPRPVELVLLLLVAAAVVLGVQALGSLLVVAVLVAPAACGRILAHRVAAMARIGAAVAVGGGVAGLYLSYWAGIAGGAAIALCLVAAYLLALAASGLARSA